MPFIRTQKLVYNDAGKIVSGSAAIVDVSYVASAEKYKSKQTVRERLGKVIEMYGKRKGLFSLRPEVLSYTMRIPILFQIRLPGMNWMLSEKKKTPGLKMM